MKLNNMARKYIPLSGGLIVPASPDKAASRAVVTVIGTVSPPVSGASIVLTKAKRLTPKFIG